VIVADVGRRSNPRGLERNSSAVLTDGISTILQAGVHIDKGLPVEASFASSATPQRHTPVEVTFTSWRPAAKAGRRGRLGVGRAGRGAAVANAYAGPPATRPRSFPINSRRLRPRCPVEDRPCPASR
jgi:isoquinoline 1-oxidoreductase beta subunit